MTANGEITARGGLETLLPAGWPKPPGYANGIAGRGRIVFVAGQVGWDATGTFVAEDFVGQTRQALLNVLAVLAEAGLGPQHIGRMTWYVTDMDAYRGSLRALGGVYREVIGPHYPAMSLIQVVSLVESQALVEIEATAIDPEDA